VYHDLKAFAERGHIAVGLEGAPHTAAMARAHSGCEVWQQDFLKLDLPRCRFCAAARAGLRQGELPSLLRGRSHDRRPIPDRDSPGRTNGNAVSNPRIRA
jgi:hypothetical protein